MDRAKRPAAMSAVDGTHSVQKASEETFEHVCDPCHFRGIQKEVTDFCYDCQEMLCRNCTDSHKGQKISRNHKISSVGELSDGAISRPSPGCRVLCDCSQNLEVAFYCQKHDDVFCQACGIIKHRTCNTVSISEHSASNSKAKLAFLGQKANKVNAEIDEIQNETKCNLNAHISQKEKVKTDIRNFRKEINRQLDLMEQNILQELDQRDLLNQQEADRYISSCTTTKQMLQTDLKLLNDVTKKSSKVDIFAAEVKVSKRLNEYKCFLQDVYQDFKLSCLTFQKNEQLLDVLKTASFIGTLQEEAVFLTRPKRKLFSGLKIASTNQVDIKLPEDQRVPAITGCVFLPDERAVLCDSDNKKLKLLSKSSFKLQECLDLPASPWDLSVVNDNTVIVTLPDERQMQYIEVEPRLKPGRVLKLDKACYGVEVADGDIYVTCHKGGLWGGEGEVRILDQDGNMKRRLVVNQAGTFIFVCPEYVAVNNKSSRIYVSDGDSTSITSLKWDGTVVYQYKDPDSHGLRGVCIDDDDNILVCYRFSNAVHIVTASGQKGKILLTKKDGVVLPLSVAYRHTDDTLLIGCKGKVLIVRLTL